MATTRMTFPTIYFVAGEVSADNHGAALMRCLRELEPQLKFIGRGGPQMQQCAGNQFKNWIGDAAVLGLWEVLRKYGYFREQFRETLKEIQENKPDAVVLIDYPGFNLRLARALQRQSPQEKVIYYISPQVWAWNPGRVKRMARSIDLVLCIFPFETDLYRKSGIRAVFVGHPMMERLQARKIDIEGDPNLIGLFPGSRSREVRKIFPIMIETARQLLRGKPTLNFQVAAASEELAREMKRMLTPHLNFLPSEGGEEKLQAACTDSGSMSAASSRDHKQSTTSGDSLSSSVDAAGTPLPLSRGEGRVRGESSLNPQVIQIKVGETAKIMQRARAGIVASGSATLEAAYFQMPFVLVYKVAWPTYLAARAVVNVNYLGMPNLLADKQVVPEFIQQQAKPDAIGKAMGPLVEDVQARQQMISAFDAIISKLGGGGASEHAAQAIVEEIKERRSPSRPGGPEAAAP